MMAAMGNHKRMRALSSFIVMAITIFGCANGPPVVGLIPEYPPVEVKIFSLHAEFIEIDSLQPTMRWQPFSPSLYTNEEGTDPAETFEDVTYEVRIWRTIAGEQKRLAYGRRDLKTPEHRLETPLLPDTRYFWSVRAHFKLNGHPRTTEWSLAGYALLDTVVPNASCLRFKTPKSPK